MSEKTPLEPSILRVGDYIRVKIKVEDGFTDELKATVIKINDTKDNRILLGLERRFVSGVANSHNTIWEYPSYTRIAKLYNVPQAKVSWWLDHTTTVLELLARAPKELPCQQCKRKNFLEDNKCWWCGYPPFIV